MRRGISLLTVRYMLYPMLTKINERVKTFFLTKDTGEHPIIPLKIRWRGRTYAVMEVGIVYSLRTVTHVVQVNVGSLDMRLHIDGDTLITTLVEVSDGLAD
jgi:hypothetical protein